MSCHERACASCQLATPSRRAIFNHMKKVLVILILLGALASWWFWPAEGKRYPPGVLIATQPVQTELDEPKVWRHKDYAFKALAAYEIRARVLSTEGYFMDRESDVSPVDFFLGWGPMSDQAVLDELDLSQRSRWAFWRYRKAPIPDREIVANAANTHLVPASDEIEDQLDDVEVGDIVTLRGYLVEITADDGWTWTSSLSRTDERGSACELLWVEDLERQ